MGTGILPAKTVSKLLEKTVQPRFQLANLLGIHAKSSLGPWKSHRFANLGYRDKAKIAL
jgi:hypothetical protein